MKLFNTKYLKPKQIYKNLKGLLKREFKKKLKYRQNAYNQIYKLLQLYAYIKKKYQMIFQAAYYD